MRNMWLIILILIAGCRISDDHFIAADDGSAVRLIAPLSMTTVTQQQPMLRWVLGPDDGAPMVDLCKDRSCTMPLAITTQLAIDQLSAVPATALPAGWVYWRVRVVVGSQTVSSATWQFWVGTLSASNSVDTSNGAILDVNGDGYPDFLVGARGASSGSGVVHLYLGSAASGATGWNGVSPTDRIDLTNPDDATASFGESVTSAGDVNGDGYADFIVGASSASVGSGAAHLYLGSATPSTTAWNGASPGKRIDLISPDGARGFFGESATSAGDVNGDGYADFLIGAYDTAARTGAAHLYLGSATINTIGWNGASPADRIDLTSPDGAGAEFGISVANGGDVNGDGYADFLVGADGAGVAHLYLGAATLGATAWNGASPVRRFDLTSPDGVATGFGISVASAGDVNGDGYTDFLVGAYGASSGDGAAHLYLGAPMPSTAAWNGAAPTGRIDLFSLDGPNAVFGVSVASAGDINGDGYADFLVGARGTSSGSGAAHLYLGGVMPSAATWNGASPSKRADLTSPDSASAAFGASVASAGDVNGDGYADFLVGAYGASSNVGATHLYLGAETPSTTTWNGSSPIRRIDLMSPDGTSANFGYAVASAGATRGSRISLDLAAAHLGTSWRARDSVHHRVNHPEICALHKEHEC